MLINDFSVKKKIIISLDAKVNMIRSDDRPDNSVSQFS